MSDNSKFSNILNVIGTIGIAREILSPLVSITKDCAIGQIKLDGWNAIRIVESYLYNKLKPGWSLNSKYSADYKNMPEVQIKSGCYPIRTLGDRYQIFYYNKIPIMARRFEEDKVDILELIYLKGVFDPDKFFIEATKYYNDRCYSTRFNIRKYIKNPVTDRIDEVFTSYSGEPPTAGIEMGMGSKPCAPKPLFIPDVSSVPMTDEMKLGISEIGNWIKSRDWYEERGIPWRRGWLLHGIPGTGKTTYAMSVAKHMDLPVVSFDLSSFSNADLITHWRDLNRFTPCMVILEDLDSIFTGRKNISTSQKGNLTFDCILNVISGADSVDGIFLVITTNYPEKLDQAIATKNEEGSVVLRHGRIDREIEFVGLNEDGRRMVASRVLKGHEEEAENLVNSYGDTVTIAEFQEVCLRRALDIYWSRPNLKVINQ